MAIAKNHCRVSRKRGVRPQIAASYLRDGKDPRGRRSAVRAGLWALATARAINLFRRMAKEVRSLGR